MFHKDQERDVAVPKKKISKSRRDMRRSHLAITPVKTVPCSNCKMFKLPHHACPTCGFYNGRPILEDKRQGI